MNRIGVWEIYEDGPKRIEESGIDLEKNLETWIEKDPSLVNAGLSIIARQLTFDQGQGRLDLLALDTQGRWVIIEIKRGEIEHETMTQVLYYAACVANMKREEIEQKINPIKYNNSKPLTELLEERDALDSLEPENRDVSMIIVGTRRSDKLDQMISFLSERYEMPISIITFHVFTTVSQNQVLIREITETETDLVIQKSKRPPSLDKLISIAEQNGIGEDYKKLIDLGNKFNLYPRTWKTSVMFAPPKNRTRCLFTVWTNPVYNKVKVYVAPSAFVEFFKLNGDNVEKLLGKEGWRHMDHEEIEDFCNNIESLLQSEEVEL